MFKKKKELENSKYLTLYFLLLKLATILAALVTVFQLYIFTYEYVEYMRNDMFHNVIFCYIGYLLLLGFMVFMEEHQVRFFVFLSGLLFIYQLFMGYILVTEKEIISLLLDDVMNIFRYGDSIAYILAFSGSMLSFYSFITAIHFLYCNNTVGVTA